MSKKTIVKIRGAGDWRGITKDHTFALFNCCTLPLEKRNKISFMNGVFEYYSGRFEQAGEGCKEKQNKTGQDLTVCELCVREKILKCDYD